MRKHRSVAEVEADITALYEARQREKWTLAPERADAYKSKRRSLELELVDSKLEEARRERLGVKETKS